MSSPAHWGWGVVGGAGIGWYYGDSLWETILGGYVGSPLGARHLAFVTKGAASLTWTGTKAAWGTRAGLALRGAGWHAARFGGAATLAVAAPVSVGGIAAYAIAGKEGVSDYADFMTGKVSPKQWWDAVTLKSMR